MLLVATNVYKNHDTKQIFFHFFQQYHIESHVLIYQKLFYFLFFIKKWYVLTYCFLSFCMGQQSVELANKINICARRN